MDFLRATAKCLFYDYSLEYVADCICPFKKSKGRQYKHLLDRLSDQLVWRERNYSRENINSVTAFIVNEWMGGGTLKGETLNRSVERCFLLLNYFVCEVLDSGYVVKFNHLLQWKDLSLYIGEDLLLCVAHAANMIKNGSEWRADTESYCWSNPIRHDHEALNNLLDQGLDDVHYHLNGSVDGAELSWIYLMNQPDRLDHLMGDVKDGTARYDGATDIWNDEKGTTSKEWVSIAILIRAVLYDWLYKGKIDKEEIAMLKRSVEVRSTQSIDMLKYVGLHKDDNLTERAGDTFRWDYAEAGGLEHKLRQSPWAKHRGERRFMTWMLMAALNESSAFKDALPLFYLYILIKIRYRKDYVQTNPLIGLQNFNHYYHALDKYQEEDWLGIKGKLNYALNTSVRKDGKDTVEMRLSTGSFDKIKETKLPEEQKNVTFVLTLYKSCRKDDQQAATKYSGMQSELLTTLRRILELIREKGQLTIVGIDVVGSDLMCRPYVIAPFLRYAAEKGITNITYHAAEDFCDIIDGLRSLDELTTFAEYKDSYRIGHASVLGVNVKKYYQERKRNVVCSRQILLDNYIWLSRIVGILNVSVAPDLHGELETKAEEQFKMIYPKLSFSADDYWDSMQMRSDMTDAFVEELYGPGVFKCMRCSDARCNKARKNEKAKVYCQEYLKRNVKGDEIVLVRHSWLVIKAIEDVREAMMKMFSERKYKVESNPTSNLMIGPFDMYKELPTVRFNKGNVNVSVNTDAKGVFSTSLYTEYSLLALAMQKDGKDWNTIETSIKELIANSRGQRFGEVKLKVPIG